MSLCRIDSPPSPYICGACLVESGPGRCESACSWCLISVLSGGYILVPRSRRALETTLEACARQWRLLHGSRRGGVHCVRLNDSEFRRAAVYYLAYVFSGGYSSCVFSSFAAFMLLGFVDGRLSFSFFSLVCRMLDDSPPLMFFSTRFIGADSDSWH